MDLNQYLIYGSNMSLKFNLDRKMEIAEKVFASEDSYPKEKIDMSKKGWELVMLSLKGFKRITSVVLDTPLTSFYVLSVLKCDTHWCVLDLGMRSDEGLSYAEARNMIMNKAKFFVSEGDLIAYLMEVKKNKARFGSQEMNERFFKPLVNSLTAKNKNILLMYSPSKMESYSERRLG